MGLGVLGGSWPTAMPGKLCTQNLTPLTFRDHGALKTLITEKVTGSGWRADWSPQQDEKKPGLRIGAESRPGWAQVTLETRLLTLGLGLPMCL